METREYKRQRTARRASKRVASGSAKSALWVQQIRDLAGAKRSQMPATIAPQLATLVKDAPDGDRWLNEIKLDGYRMLCRIDDGGVEFISRNNLHWTHHFQSIAESVKRLPVKQVFLDGEVVVMTSGGKSDFQQLQNALRKGRHRAIVYYAFDLLFLDGHDLRQVPLEQRKELLAKMFEKITLGGLLRYSDHIVGHGPQFFRAAARHGLEGIICKRRDRSYVSGRSQDWLKVKCIQSAEFVIGGYTKSGSAQGGFGALLLGQYEEGGLVYAGRVGTGFSSNTMADLRSRLDKLLQSESPFRDMRGKKAKALDARWVRPELVAQVNYLSQTRDGQLRHASFVGLREDKRVHEVVRESPTRYAAL